MKFFKTHWPIITVFFVGGFLIFLSNINREININSTTSISSILVNVTDTTKKSELTSTTLKKDNSDNGLNKSLSKLLFKVKTAASPKGLIFSPDNKEI
jgi:hypothetical protein